MDPSATVQETEIGMGGRKKGCMLGCKFPRGEIIEELFMVENYN